MGVLKVKTAPGVWTPVTQGFDPFHTQQSAFSAGGTVAQGASVTLVSLVTPVVPVGRMLLVTMSAQVRQTTASAFDLNFAGPGGAIVPNQFGTGVNATGQIVTHTMMVPSDGTAMTFRIDVSAWGAQPVTYSNRSNISVTVMPLASAVPTAWTPYVPVWGAATTPPNLGTTPTVQGAYQIVGKTCNWRAYFATGGTGIATGNGAYNVTLPPTPTTPTGAGQVMGKGICYGGAGFVTFIADNGIPANKARLIRCDIINTYFDHTVGPNGSGHVLEINGSYEIA